MITHITLCAAISAISCSLPTDGYAMNRKPRQRAKATQNREQLVWKPKATQNKKEDSSNGNKGTKLEKKEQQEGLEKEKEKEKEELPGEGKTVEASVVESREARNPCKWAYEKRPWEIDWTPEKIEFFEKYCSPEDIEFCKKHYEGKTPWELTGMPVLWISAPELEFCIPHAHLVWCLQIRSLYLCDGQVFIMLDEFPDSTALYQVFTPLDKFPNLTHLNLDNTRISDKGIQYLAERCPDLTSLRLGCTNVGDLGLKAIIPKCSNLTELDLRSTLVTDHGLKVIAQHCPNLACLILLNTKVSDVGLEAIAEGCKNLTGLDLRFNTKISNRGIKAIANHCPRLTVLYLSSINVTDLSVLRDFPHLTKLCLSIGDTDNTDLSILMDLPNLQTLWLHGRTLEGKKAIKDYLSTLSK